MISADLSVLKLRMWDIFGCIGSSFLIDYCDVKPINFLCISDKNTSITLLFA